MPLESLTGSSVFIDDLNELWPLGTDGLDNADNHIRGIKNVLVNSFPNISGAMTASHAELNALAGQAGFVNTFLQAADIAAARTAIGAISLDLDGAVLILDADGDTTLAGDTDDVITLTVGGNDAWELQNIGYNNQPESRLESTDAGVGAGPTVRIIRDSATPAASDLIGHIIFQGNNDTPTGYTYGFIGGRIDDPTTGSEDSCLLFQTSTAGAIGQPLVLGAGAMVGTTADPGAGKLSVQTGYEVGGSDVSVRELLDSATASASATLDLTAASPATYDYFEVDVRAFSSTSGTAFFCLRVGDGSFDATASSYATAGLLIDSAGARSDFGTTATEGQPALRAGSAASQGGINGRLRIYPTASGRTLIEWELVGYTASGTPWHGSGSVIHTVNLTEFDRIQFFFDTGSVNSGTVKLYGRR